jgi:hypothetical protein
MALNFPNDMKGKRWRLHLDGFSNMKRLRMLKIGNIDCVENISELYAKLSTLVWHGNLSKFVLPDELRIIEWCGCPLKSLPYPLKSLPPDFEPDKLVELSMPFSPIQKLWKGVKVRFLLMQMCIHLLYLMLSDLLAYNRVWRI